MDNKKLFTNLTIKTEPNTSPTKKVLLPSSPFAQLANKSISSARLASFKPPRDLLLTGSTTCSTNSALSLNCSTKSTRRTFVPNINVTRKKGGSETSTNDSNSESNQRCKREKDKDKKPSAIKKRNANVVQTKGVFSEGLAPGKVKAFKSSISEKAYNDTQVMEKTKLNLNKTIIKSNEDNKLKSILKDDFIDDPNIVPDINFIPSSLPMVYNVKKQENANDLEKTFEALQVKNEKVSNVSLNELKNETPDVTSIFEGVKEQKLFLFEFPGIIQQKDEPSEKKKSSKGQQNETEKQSEKSKNLSSLGEGFLGYLRIHENGKAYLVMGKTMIPLCVTRHGTRQILASADTVLIICLKQEVMSTCIDKESSKGEVISLGTVDTSFTCSANFLQDL